jgi:hypothetical protein
MIKSEVLGIVYPLKRAGWLFLLDDENYHDFSTKSIISNLGIE